MEEKRVTLISKHGFAEATINRSKHVIYRVCVCDLNEMKDYTIKSSVITALVKELEYAPITYANYDDKNKRNIIEILATAARVWQEGNKVYCDLSLSTGALRNLLFDVAEKAEEYLDLNFRVVFKANMNERTIEKLTNVQALDLVAGQNDTARLIELHIHKFDKEGGRETDLREKELREKSEVKIASNILKNAGLPTTELNIKRVRFCDNKQSLYQILNKLRKQYDKPEIEDEDEVDLGLSREERYEAIMGTTAKGISDAEWARRLKESRKQLI